ncbi:MAG TPA: 6-bladed beta-propeller, partial [Nitrospiria bacterium]|nr:6-bladed beta-propeller [Nitrospiria bacterium]
MIWPLPPDEPRIKFIRSIYSSADIEQKSFGKSLTEFVVGADPQAKLIKPYAVHADKDGRIFVADAGW